MKNAAIQLLIFDPSNVLPEEQRGVVVNPWLKQRFEQFVPIGVFLDKENLSYYFFEECDNPSGFYTSLNDLKEHLPKKLEDLFTNKPKLFVMGHANGGYYGLGNAHGQSEQFYGEKFDALLYDFKQTLPKTHGEIFVTLEGCNTDSPLDASANNRKNTFLQRVSKHHKDITFSGTGPWHATEPLTGARSLAPKAPVTSMAGNVWKAGNRVIFYHGDTQIAVKKSLFATTETAKAQKVNTVEYARALLGDNASDEQIEKIALARNILSIEDLPLPKHQRKEFATYLEEEQRIKALEKENYLDKIHDILHRAHSTDELTNRDILELLLGLKEPRIFDGNENLFNSILANKALLSLAMVGCGKVLVGGPSNDVVIDLLLENGASINSIDKKGMTALHYAAQNFYNYRQEPLNLINKFLRCGARADIKDVQANTPVDVAIKHSKDGRVTGGEKLIEMLTQTNAGLTPLVIKESVRRVFQMSQHKADELVSLPEAKREYSQCGKGTLYIPETALDELHDILLSAKGNKALISAFENELKTIMVELVNGKGTGTIIGEDDEFVNKCFDDVEHRLKPAIDALAEMKQEVVTDITEGPSQLNRF